MSSLPVDYDFEVWRGDSWSQRFTFQQPAGSPINWTGLTVVAYARPAHSTAAPTQLTATKGSAASGQVTIGPPSSGPLAVGAYDYDVQVTDGAGVVTTWVKGTLTVRQDVSP